ncbi:hypothetical protein [Lacticaseibacillus kribbianus]|uniref:hypothetical protein n=1 Tax=Lacticaseibacillus kribbianus TaxID=2926292 RepID=UPI001CD5C69F|nr:hypothetical protein [Lacticaseibacillus kribbianus]
MTLIAILIDGLAAAGYHVQATSGLHMAGTIFQGVLTLALLIMTFAYKGKRLGWFNFSTWAHNFTFRYAVIILSLIVNAVLLFVYVLNVTGQNTELLFH